MYVVIGLRRQEHHVQRRWANVRACGDFASLPRKSELRDEPFENHVGSTPIPLDAQRTLHIND